MKVKDIKLSKYSTLSEVEQKVYELWFDYIQPLSELQGQTSKGHNDWTFDEVAFIKQYINDFNHVEKIFDICFKNLKINDLYLFEVLAWRKWVINEVDTILDLESRISNAIEPELELAGIDELNKFKEWNTKIDLGSQFGVKPQDIGDWKWQDVFVIMWRNSTVTRVQKRYQELKSKTRK